MKHNEDLKTIGIHTITKCTVKTKEAFKIYDKIMQLLKGNYDPAEFRYWHEKLHRFVNSKHVYYNTVVNVGRNIVANSILPAGSRNYTGNGYIEWGALGNDAAAPTIGDTGLGNETYRKAVQDASISGQTATFLTFWNLAEANAQHYEAGEFIDGSITLDTGNLFARWNIDENKTATETLSITSNYLITQ